MKAAERKKIAKLIVANWCRNAEFTMFDDRSISISEKDQGLIVEEIQKMAKDAPPFNTTKEIIDSVLQITL